METARCALEVRVHGRPVREYYHQDQIWIEGRRGSDFTLRLSNRRMGRILMVPSIDGLSIMDGKSASYDDRGYIIDGRGFVDVPGWRLNDSEVATFRFSTPPNSYAAQKGQPSNVGVIGCAVFEEMELPIIRTTHPRGPAVYSSSGTLMGMSSCSRVAEIADNAGPSLGTGFGARADHLVREVAFKKATSQPLEVLSIGYGDREELRQRGIDLAQKPIVVGNRDPFPGEQGCEPPAGWRR